MTRIIETRYESQNLRLWHAADDLIEYRQRTHERDGQYHSDLLNVANHVQAAAKAAQREDNATVHDQLIAASQAAEDLDVREDIYRLIYSLGFGCPAHGAKTFTYTSGGMHYAGGDVWDDITEHECCQICGEEVHTSSLDGDSPKFEIYPDFPLDTPPANHVPLEVGNAENVQTQGLAVQGQSGAR